mgnify:CR=1 FL=1
MSRYRKVVESLCKERLGVVKASSSVEEIERKIGAGQAEQLIKQVHVVSARGARHVDLCDIRGSQTMTLPPAMRYRHRMS